MKTKPAWPAVLSILLLLAACDSQHVDETTPEPRTITISGAISDTAGVPMQTMMVKAYHITEALKLMGTCCWITGRQGRALKWWRRSINEGERIDARLELSRCYFEVAKRLNEPESKFKQLDGISAEEYLNRAKEMFLEMDLQWDLDELERIATA